MKNNIPQTILDKVQGKRLHRIPNHPICIIRKKIEDYFNKNAEFVIFDSLSPWVSPTQNFDNLLIPLDHPSRRQSDSYYQSDSLMLRTHTSAHQVQCLRVGCKAFLVSGDVYRRDEIDRYHYPVFHQMEGVKVMGESQSAVEDLKSVLIGLIEHLFPGCEYRINDSYFPFTNPSFEFEVKYEDQWIEVLGCGQMQPEILRKAGYSDPLPQAWAFGLGLERLAMVLFKIPDIRLFWSDDPRFLEQFKEGEIKTFVPYSKHPACIKDMAFWVEDEFNSNDFYDLVRSDAGDLVEKIELVDKFVHPKTQKTSHCYRVNYRSNERALSNEEVNVLHNKIAKDAEDRLHVKVR